MRVAATAHRSLLAEASVSSEGTAKGKEQVIADFREALERNGIVTEGWWERQLTLALLGAVVQFGWEKALGDDDELGWWCDRAGEGFGAL